MTKLGRSLSWFSQVFRDHRADFRVRNALALRVAGVHVIAADPVIDRLGLHAADDAQLVRVPGHFWEILADLDAVDVGLDRPERPGGRSAGLHVESVDLTDPAFHVKHDTALAQSFRFRGNRLRMN